MAERMLVVDGIELCVDDFGDPGDPAIVLVGGAESSFDWWEPALCERLAAGGRHVVRYDLRDTGRSTHWPPGEPGYTGGDLDADLRAIIMRLGLAPAHLVGISMGGMLVQQVAVRHPELVASLTLLSTTPSGPGNDENGLPPMSSELSRAFEQKPSGPDWTDRAAVQQHFVDGEHLLAGGATVDDETVREVAGRAFDRSAPGSMASGANHYLVGDSDDPIARSELAGIGVPTLVIHGERDPLFPIGHGEALAREIPGARLVRVADLGHSVPPARTWDQLVPAILANTGGSSTG
jgi:pimeloyl-ACP methyl ester carboxylesterase